MVDSAYETRIESILTLKEKKKRLADVKTKVKTNVWLRIVCFPRFNWRFYSSWAEDLGEDTLSFTVKKNKKKKHNDSVQFNVKWQK